MDRLGFGYGAMSAVNPKLIYCSISGYGQTGPRSPAAAYDAAIQAASGMMSVTGTPDSGPIKTGYWTIDMTTATQACFAISASLYRRERTGEGDYLDLSMLDTAAGIMAPNLAIYATNGTAPSPSGNRSQTGNPVADVYPASDGHVMIAAATQNQFLSLAKLLGREDLTVDPRFVTLSDRIANADTLRTLLGDAFSRERAVIWEERLMEAGIPAARVATVPQVWHENAQLIHRGTFRTVPRQRTVGEGDWPYVDVAFHSTREVDRTHPPGPPPGRAHGRDSRRVRVLTYRDCRTAIAAGHLARPRRGARLAWRPPSREKEPPPPSWFRHRVRRRRAAFGFASIHL